MSAIQALLVQPPPKGEPAADTALAQLARAAASLMQQKTGQTLEGRITALLAGGLTQLEAGGEALVLRLEPPLPPGMPVTIRVTSGADGRQAITVQPQAQPVPVPVPVPVTATPAPLPQVANTLAAQVQAGAVAASPVAPQALTAPQAVQTQAPTLPAPAAHAASPALATAPSHVNAAAATMAAPAVQTPSASVPAAAPMPTSPPLAASQGPAPAQQQLPAAMMAATATTPRPAAMSQALPVAQPTGPTAAVPLAAAAPAAAPALPIGTTALPASVPPVAPSALAGQIAKTPGAMPQAPDASAPAVPRGTVQAAAATQVSPPPPAIPYAASPAVGSGASPPLAASALPGGQPSVPATAPLSALVLGSPSQAAARQDSVAPLLAHLNAIAASGTALPQPVVAAALRLMATRIDLSRALPDGAALKAAVLGAGVVTLAGAKPHAGDAKSALLQLRGALLGALGGGVPPVDPAAARASPPLRGDDPRAARPELPPMSDATPEETARTLLGQTESAISRLKLLQLASQPAETRPGGPAPATEFRIEVPMLLGAETGMLQLVVQRDAKRREQPGERGWRMRFALAFSAIGDIGADIALLGRTTSISIWATEPATAEALEETLPELAAALAGHGLAVAGLRVRRGAPTPAPASAGRLLDSAR